MFDLHLLLGFWTDFGESYIKGKLKTRRTITRWSFLEKLRTVAMVMKKTSKTRGISLMVMNLWESDKLCHIDKP